MRGTIQETRPGVWRLRVVVGYRPDGQPRQASKTVHGTRRAAQDELAKFLFEAQSGNTPLVGAMTLAAYFERWLEHVRAHRQPDTTRNYALKCKRFTAELGRVRLDKLQVHQLDEVYRKWMAEGMAPSTLQAHHSVISAALSQAVKWGLVQRSVAPLTTRPTVPLQRGCAIFPAQRAANRTRADSIGGESGRESLRPPERASCGRAFFLLEMDGY